MDDDATARRRDAAGDSAPPERASQPDALNPTLFDLAGHLSVEMLSVYLDEPGTFAATDLRLVETHLATCESCQVALVELRQIVNALAALPQPALPRSFALTPTQARQRTPVVVTEPRWWQRAEWSAQLGKLRWATAVAALLFVFVLSVDLLGNGTSATSTETHQSSALSRDSASGAAAGATAATTGGAAPATTNLQSNPPQATTGAAAAMPTTASGATAASPTAASGSVAADTAASPASSEGYALKSNPEATASSVVAPEAAAPGLPPAVSAAPTDTHNAWRVAEAGLALLTAWLLTAMLVIPLLVRRDAGRDS